MSLVDLDIFGVFIAPITVMLILSALVIIAISWLFDRFNLIQHVWHPSVFIGAIYIIVLSTLILIADI